MTREQIEKEAIKYAKNECHNCDEASPNIAGFVAGAQWLADKLCIIPWDKALKELHDYYLCKKCKDKALSDLRKEETK